MRRTIRRAKLTTRYHDHNTRALTTLRTRAPTTLDGTQGTLTSHFTTRLCKRKRVALIRTTIRTLRARRELLMYYSTSTNALLRTQVRAITNTRGIFSFKTVDCTSTGIQRGLDTGIYQIGNKPIPTGLAHIQTTRHLINTSFTTKYLRHTRSAILFLNDQGNY